MNKSLSLVVTIPLLSNVGCGPSSVAVDTVVAVVLIAVIVEFAGWVIFASRCLLLHLII